jgi:hypothetical protein
LAVTLDKSLKSDAIAPAVANCGGNCGSGILLVTLSATWLKSDTGAQIQEGSVLSFCSSAVRILPIVC